MAFIEAYKQKPKIVFIGNIKKCNKSEKKYKLQENLNCDNANKFMIMSFHNRIPPFNPHDNPVR